MPNARNTKTETVRQFWYIAYEQYRNKLRIRGFGRSPQGAKVSATRRGANGRLLDTTVAAKALCDAYALHGERVRFRLSPANGRASLIA